MEVSPLCENYVMRAVINQFGTDVETEVVDEDHFRVKVSVCLSPTFYRWLFGWGWEGAIVVEGPEEACSIENASKGYEETDALLMIDFSGIASGMQMQYFEERTYIGCKND